MRKQEEENYYENKKDDYVHRRSHHGIKVYGNSHDFVKGYSGSRHSLSCVLIGEQDGDEDDRQPDRGGCELADQRAAEDHDGGKSFDFFAGICR